MKMKNEKILELCQALDGEPDGSQQLKFKSDNVLLTVDVTKKGNNINISYKKDRNNNKIKEDFKEYLNSIPDDIFVDACNLFTKEFGISMNDLNKLLDTDKAESMVNSFKEEIKNAAVGKIMENVNLINSLSDKFDLGFTIA